MAWLVQATKGDGARSWRQRKGVVMVIRYFNGLGQNRAWHDQGKIAEVRAYWEALRQDGQLPHRQQIDPRGIAGPLDHTFLIERIGTGLAQVRIAGMVFHDLMGMDLCGMPLSAMFLAEARLQLQMALERMFHGPACLSLTLRSPASMGREALQARMIALPLRGASGLGLGQNGGSTMALGCLEVAGTIARQPRRFMIDTTDVTRLAVPDDQPDDLVVPTGALASVPAQPATHPAPHPYLRLVHSAP